MTITSKRNQFDLAVPVERNLLRSRHRLSHQQIDWLLNENSGKKFIDEKISQLQHVRIFMEVSELLRQNGISFISLKGPLLSCRIYKDPTIRISHDIDLLIDAEMIGRVIKLLYNADYQFSSGEFWPETKSHQKIFIKKVHHLSFFNTATKSCVEIHWVLMHELPVSLRKQKEIILKNIKEVEFSGKTFSVLGAELELIYLMIHGARHGWQRLKWLIDIKDYPLQEIDPVVFDGIALQLKATRIIAQTDILMAKYLNTSFKLNKNFSAPNFLIKYANELFECEIVNNLSNEQELKRIHYIFLLFPGIYYKWHIISDRFIRVRDLREVHSSWNIVYYLYRPFSFIKRRILHA